MKMPKFGTKNVLFRIWLFLGKIFSKTIVIFEINTLKFVKNDSLTHIGNFGIGSTFSKGAGSAFSEGPGPGPGPLYKVWQMRNVEFFVRLTKMQNM